MKIGILTFYYAHNYGAVLQAYALLTYLRKKGHESYIIPYKNKEILKMYPPRLKPLIAKKNIINPMKWSLCFSELKKVLCSKKEWQRQYNKFENFISNYLVEDETKPWNNIANSMDIIFFGSDQIWEQNIIGQNERIYLGDFQTRAKKISYAASCFSEKSVFTKYMIEKLKDFSLISVRENKLSERLKKELQKDIYIVCDPVFLLDKSVYKKLVSKNIDYGKYVLFYFVSEDKELQKICNRIRKQKKIRVIEIHYFKMQIRKKIDSYYDIGPIEFLTLFYHADFIFTNSFHGTAFSIIFEKDFLVKSMNIRLFNLLRLMNLENRIINTYEEWKKTKKSTAIDYDKVNIFRKRYIKRSKKYIEKAINLVE